MLRPLLYLLLLGLFFVFSAPALAGKTVAGRVETVILPEYGIHIQGRVDTGAHTSSLHLSDFKIVARGDDKFVEFDTADEKGKKYHIKAKIYKTTVVKNTAGIKSQRYVIRSQVKLGDVTKTININLNDRSDLKYKFLIGRNLLRGNFLVDVSRSHILGTALKD